MLNMTWDLQHRTAQGTLQYLVAACLGGSLGEMDTCVRVAESLHCFPETITTFLIGYAGNACVLSHVRLLYPNTK